MENAIRDAVEDLEYTSSKARGLQGILEAMEAQARNGEPIKPESLMLAMDSAEDLARSIDAACEALAGGLDA